MYYVTSPKTCITPDNTKLAVMERLFCLFGGFEMFESHKTLFLYDEIHICNRVFYVCANVHAFTIKTVNAGLYKILFQY